MDYIKTFEKYINENDSYLQSDAIGYNIGKYLYHVTPISNIEKIEKDGFIPTDGTSINGTDYRYKHYI